MPSPYVVRRSALLRANEVLKLHRVAYEEDRSVVTHKVPVALVCVELQRESTDVSLGVRGTAFAGDGKKGAAKPSESK